MMNASYTEALEQLVSGTNEWRAVRGATASPAGSPSPSPAFSSTLGTP